MKEYIKHNLNAYNELSDQYRLKIWDYIDKDKITSSIFREYLKYNFKVIKVLELGPGSWLTLSNFESEWFKTTAIDFSKKMIEVAKKVTLKTNYLLGDFLTYDFEQLKFNGIYAQAFIHLFPEEDVKVVFKKIFNLLESNWIAHISTTVHDISDEGYFEKEDYTGEMKRFRRKWTEDELLNEIKDTWFVIHDKKYIIEPNNGKKWIIIVAIRI